FSSNTDASDTTLLFVPDTSFYARRKARVTSGAGGRLIRAFMAAVLRNNDAHLRISDVTESVPGPPRILRKMKSTIGSIHLHWLLAPGAEFATPVDESLTVHHLDYQIPPEIGTAWLKVLALSDDFKLYQAVHHLQNALFGQLVQMLDVTESKSEPIFSAQTWLSGIGCHLEYPQGRGVPPMEIWGRPGLDTFRLKCDWDARVLVAGGGVTEMRSICIARPLLDALLGDTVDTRLLAQLGLDESTTAVTHQIPLHLNAPLQEAMSDQYAGPARRLFAQAKALEYLGGLVEFLHADDKKSSPRRHTKKIHELKEHLLCLDGRLPTLNQLAENFGLSAKQLNIEFKAEFGQSIFDYVTTQRLEQAHDALLESSIPMKVIAERLGYSHVNHFITAFKRKFGYPPGTVRKVRSQQ
ncbi:MAG: helix-turn-helix transcriptional regulator, partial [Rhodocyclaceae bacterium]|nr:helix-turn-helix transcriptional regulator [Rhodocyclaceae bacterium]